MNWFLFTSCLITSGVLMTVVEQGEGLGFGSFGNFFKGAADGACKHKAVIYGNKEFSFHPNLVTWSVAKSFCKTVCGGRIAQPETKEENDFISSHIHKFSDKCKSSADYWFGLRRVEGTRKYAFIDRGPLSYTSWALGQPSFIDGYKKEEDCAHYWCKSSDRPKWNDRPCDMNQKYICEKRVSHPVTTTETMMGITTNTKSSTGISLMTAPPETMTTRLNLTTEAISPPTTWSSTTHTTSTAAFTTSTLPLFTASPGTTMIKSETTTFLPINMTISTSFEDTILWKDLRSKGSAKENGRQFCLVMLMWVIIYTVDITY